MFCTRCGVQLEESDHFCYRCGTMTSLGPSPYVQRPLRRVMTGKKLGGVCAGVAEHLGADALAVRLIWVLISLGLPPVGIIGYIIAWIVIPKAPMVPAGFVAAPEPQS